MKVEMVMGKVNEISDIKINEFSIEGYPKRGKKKLTDIELTRSLIARLKKHENLLPSSALMLSLILKIAERFNKKCETLEEIDRFQKASLKARKERIIELEAENKVIKKHVEDKETERITEIVRRTIISDINSNVGGLRDMFKAVKQ